MNKLGVPTLLYATCLKQYPNGLSSLKEEQNMSLVMKWTVFDIVVWSY